MSVLREREREKEKRSNLFPRLLLVGIATGSLGTSSITPPHQEARATSPRSSTVDHQSSQHKSRNMVLPRTHGVVVDAHQFDTSSYLPAGITFQTEGQGKNTQMKINTCIKGESSRPATADVAAVVRQGAKGENGVVQQVTTDPRVDCTEITLFLGPITQSARKVFLGVGKTEKSAFSNLYSYRFTGTGKSLWGESLEKTSLHQPPSLGNLHK